MFVTNSSSGKGEEKNKSLLANGPLTIEGRNIYQYSRVLFWMEKWATIYLLNSKYKNKINLLVLQAISFDYNIQQNM